MAEAAKMDPRLRNPPGTLTGFTIGRITKEDSGEVLYEPPKPEGSTDEPPKDMPNRVSEFFKKDDGA